VARLWREISVKLPVDCCWVVYGRPVWFNPQSGIIFASQADTLTYALRFQSENVKKLCRREPNEYRRTWVVPNSISPILARSGCSAMWFKGEDQWCLAAFLFAADVT